MKKISVGLMAMVCAVVLAGCDEAVKVSSFGYDPEDSTEFIQKALDSGAKRIVFDRQSGPWVARPLFGRSNQEIYFEDGVELVAKRGEFHGKRDMLLSFTFCTNVVLRGLGERGGVFRMWKKDYQDKANYTPAEWRYTLGVYSVSNMVIENLSFVASGGDGVCIASRRGPDGRVALATDVTMRRCVCDDNHRQALTMGSGRNILIEDCVFKNTCGTPPQAGVDFEPDAKDEGLVNCVMRRCRFENNRGSGVEFYGQNLDASTPPMSVLIDDCETVGNAQEAAVQVGSRIDGSFVRGEFRFRNCRFGKSRGRDKPHFIVQESKFGQKTVFENCVGADNVRRSQPMADGVLELTGGVMPKRCELPPAAKVTVDDAKPGEMVELAPVEFPSHGNYVFFAEKGAEVKFRMRQTTPIKERTAVKGKVKVIGLNATGKESGKWEFDEPGFEGGEIVFKSPRRGFYRLVSAASNVRFLLEAANVPVAINMLAKNLRIVGRKGRAFSLYFRNQGAKAAFVAMSGNWYYKFRAALFDPDGKEFWRRDIVEDSMAMRVPSGRDGLWRFEFSKAAKPTYDWIYLAAYETEGCFFLSKEKTWKSRD